MLRRSAANASPLQVSIRGTSTVFMSRDGNPQLIAGIPISNNDDLVKMCEMPDKIDAAARYVSGNVDFTKSNSDTAGEFLKVCLTDQFRRHVRQYK